MTRLLTLALFFATTIAQAATLTPLDVSQFAVTPKTESTFQWKTSEPVPMVQLRFTIVDAFGNATPVNGTATSDGDTVSVTLAFPQGYWEITFDALNERFGIVSLPASEKWDTFFAIDGALSWLVRGDDLREGMIKLCKRTGIGMVRERFNFAGIAPADGRFNWHGGGNYDLLRETYKKHGIEVLECFHDVPPWMGRIKVFPEDLLAFANATDKIAERWEHTWGGIELWNEPDIFFGGDLPADQYLPLVKAYAYRAKERGSKTPIVGGSLAHANQEWLYTAKANNLLDLIDVFSFHTYDRAPNMENIVQTYRSYVANGNQPTMPLWLTECGRPWNKGPNRPPVAQDFESAIDIVMKDIESKCCGIDRYFAFVLPYYEENDNNFGMLGKDGTPLRSFAGYAQSIHALAHKEYIGDLKSEALMIANAEDSPRILRARVFRNPTGGEYVVVLYTGSTKPTQFQTAFSVQKAETVTGELCEPTEIRTGLIYLYADTIAEDMIQTETNAMRLLSITKRPPVPQRPFRGLSPIVPVYQYDENLMRPTSKGYRLDPALERSQITFEVFNLSDKTQWVEIGLNGPFPLEHFEIKPYYSRIVRMGIEMLPVEERNIFHFDYVVEEEGKDGWSSGGCIEMRFFGSPTMEGQHKGHPDAVRIPLHKERFTPNVSGNGRLDIEPVADGVKISATFGNGDKWCYPRLRLPEDLELKASGGIFAKIRYTGEGTMPRIFLFEQQSGAGFLSEDIYLTPYEGVKEGAGKWYVIAIPFSAFTYNASTPPPLDGKLVFDRIKEMSFGFNTTGGAATLEIEEVWVYK
ncbi:MAG: hypothetical protein FWE95_08860 [Planctomycetaceae bacterium]|nr:hypothetical protein [Planctomycetaceae bacterium]